jgi:superfamily I DNA/RNA helicase
LKRVYRNTQEIFEFSQRFLNKKRDRNQQLALLPKSSSYHGDQPILRPFPNLEAIEVFLVKDLRAWIKRGDYKRSEIAIIYDDKIYGPEQFAYDNRALPMGVFKKLEDAGIPTQWVSQDVGTKESFDVTTDKVSLISIHSSKGLDFDLVYLMGVDHINLTDPLRKNLITLLYVAMTRAKHRLIIPYVRESELILRMKDCLTKI